MNIYKKINKYINKLIDKFTMFAFGEIFQDTIKHCVIVFCLNILFFLSFLIFFSLTNSLPFANIVSIVIILLKEKLDKKYTTGFSKKDVFYGVVGLFISDVFIITIASMI